MTQSRLFKFCILMGNSKEQAEDLCQEAYIKAFLSLNKLDSPSSFYPWLCQIAKNIHYDWHRKFKETLSKEGEVLDESVSAGDPNYDSVLLVKNLMADFDEESKFLFLLIELEGMSYSEAAEALHTTEDAVRSKLHRIRQEFAKKIKK